MQRFPGPLPEKRLSSWHLVDVGLLKSRLSEIELASSDHQLVHRAIEEFTQHISQYTSELKHCKFFKYTFYVYVLLLVNDALLQCVRYRKCLQGLKGD